MKIIDIITSDKPSLSMEVFPPKTTAAYESVQKATEDIASLKPSFMSVTYGAGGGTSDFTVSIASNIEKNYGVTALAHLSCISSTKEQVKNQLRQLKENGIENILALRGDIPNGMSTENLDYRYASELVSEIAETGDFCIGGACYPESHPESTDSFSDIRHLKEKADCGCQFFTTQMFFDNDILYNFMYRIREAGITVPVVAGIMPVVNPKSIKRICSISGTALPQRFCRIVDKYGYDSEKMKQAGIAYATEQIIDLYANGVNAVHIYSMNRPDVAEAIMRNVSKIIE
ncbi:MAG: methylenetetrahydrofolate reductase [NAD(P)H] [Oscillospiraceae bacterium]|nr:methylenetetrahydrofolate reductase [NAD(P)H] [Oscillospiraceae bacterium]